MKNWKFDFLWGTVAFFVKINIKVWGSGLELQQIHDYCEEGQLMYFHGYS